MTREDSWRDKKAEEAFEDIFIFYVDELDAKTAEASGRYTSIRGPGWYWRHDGWVDGPHSSRELAREDQRGA